MCFCDVYLVSNLVMYVFIAQTDERSVTLGAGHELRVGGGGGLQNRNLTPCPLRGGRFPMLKVGGGGKVRFEVV